MAKINNKAELAEYLQEKLLTAESQETIDLINDIAVRYLPKANDRDLTPAEVEAHFYHKMRNVYSEFSFRVLHCAPDFTAAEAKALKAIIEILRRSAEAQNKSQGLYKEPFAVDNQVLNFWQVMLSEQFWNSLPDWLQKRVYLRQMRNYIKNYIQEMYVQLRKSDTGKELKKQKDAQDFAELLKLRGF